MHCRVYFIGNVIVVEMNDVDLISVNRLLNFGSGYGMKLLWPPLLPSIAREMLKVTVCNHLCVGIRIFLVWGKILQNTEMNLTPRFIEECSCRP